MNRSAVIALGLFVVLAGVLMVITQPYWKALSPPFLALMLGLTTFSAAVAAVSARRVFEPELKTPILVWIAVIGIAIFVIVVIVMGKAKSTNRNEHRHHDHDHDHHRRSWFSSPSSGASTPGMGRVLAVLATLLSLGAYGGGIALTRELATNPPVHTPTDVAAANPAKPVPPTPTPPPAPTNIVDVPDLAAAIAFAKLTDTRDAPSAGAKQLARYSAAKLRWNHVAVTKNETTLELAEKDPMAAAGKRLCVTGKLERIEKQTVEGVTLHTARLVTADRDAVEVYAVGSTGQLVKRKPAKFCGVVTGRLDAKGGTATFAVGMFHHPAEANGE